MPQRLRLLWIAESAVDVNALPDVEQMLAVECSCERVRPSECGRAISEASWDALVWSVVDENPDTISALSDPARRPWPPSIVIANAVHSVADAAYALRARVCERSRLSVQLPAALRAVLAECEARRNEERTIAFEGGQRSALERVAAGAPIRELLGAIVRLVEEQGAGLGLSVVHGIVRKHDGAIEVRSTLTEGSCCSVYLPAASGAQLRAARPANLAAVRSEGERVLCIDDEEPLVRVTAQMLRRSGFEVVGAIDPLDALSTFEADPAQFDVVLTDFAMPRLSCFDLVRAIHKVRPKLPIVVTSGRIDAEDVERLRGLGIREVVFKPSTIAELSAALRRALRNVKTG